MSLSNIEILPVTTDAQRREWDEFASRSTVGQMHQCLWWAEPLAPYGVLTHVLGCWKRGQLVGGGLFRSVPVPFSGMYMTECVKGPIFSEWDPTWADPFVRQVRGLARKARSLAVVIRGCANQEVHEDLLQAFQRAHLRTTLTPGALEAVISLKGRTMEDVRKNFSHGTKYEIKKSLNGPTRVVSLTSTDELRMAYESWMATVRRKNLMQLRPWPAFEPVLRHCVDSGQGLVLGTTLDGRILASVFVSCIGRTAVYVMGGYMDGAEPHSRTHILQSEAIRHALEREIDVYSFGFLAGRVAKHGVDQFKLGFGAVPQEDLAVITWERMPWLYHSVGWFASKKLGKRVRNVLRQRMLGKHGTGSKQPSASKSV